MPSVDPYDVFVSYNSKDRKAVVEIATQLKGSGLRVWLDIWCLPPGSVWQDTIEQIIETCGSVAVFVGPDGIGPWEQIEMRACLMEFAKRRLPVIPVLLPKAGSPPELPVFLRGFTYLRFAQNLTDQESMNRLVWGINENRTKVGTHISPTLAENSSRFQSDLIAEIVLLLILDQYPEGVWGRSLAASSGSWGHKEDPGSITVSYWASAHLKAIPGNSTCPEADRFSAYLKERSKDNGSVGMRRQVGSDYSPAWEIVENRRHTAMAVKWWLEAEKKTDRAFKGLAYLARSTTRTGAWSAVGDCSDQNADPLTTAYVLRTLLDAHEEGVLEALDWEPIQSFVETYRVAALAWLHRCLRETDYWWLYKKIMESRPSAETMARAYNCSAEILAFLPEFARESPAHAKAYRTVLQKLADLWRSSQVGIPGGFSTQLPHLNTSVAFLLACYRTKDLFPELAHEFLSDSRIDLVQLIKVSESDAAGWCLTLAYIRESYGSLNISPTTLESCRHSATQIWKARNDQDSRRLNSLLSRRPAWSKEIIAKGILSVKARPA